MKFLVPTIFLSVINIDEFIENIPKSLIILKELQHKGLIIHPICENQPIKKKTLEILNEKVKFSLDTLKPKVNIKLLSYSC